MSDPWFKFFASDWLAGTSGMTAAERGVYITLVAMIYDEGGPIRYDDARLARRCGVTKASWLKIIETLIDDRKIFVTADGRLSNRRCEIEISDRVNRVENATIASAKAAEARAAKSQQKQRQYLPPDDVPVTAAPPKPEARSQIEDDDDRRGRENDGLMERACAAAGTPLAALTGSGSRFGMSPKEVEALRRWRDDLGLTSDQIIASIADQAARLRSPPRSMTYFTPGLQQLASELRAPPLEIPQQSTGGPTHDQKPARRDDRATAADDALRERIEGAARNRSPSKGGIRFS